MMAAAAMMAATSLFAQTERSDDFKAKYKLKEVVVMSRHNIRSPLTSGGAAYMRVTPYEWFKWTSPSSQLSQRGGVLETEMGQFFRKWVVSAGLFPDNYRPVDNEVLFYANSRQRTFTTAKYFSAGFLPFANVEIQHKYDEDKMDPVFKAQFTKMNDEYRQQILAEMETLHGGPEAWMQSVQPTLTLMEEVIDILEEPPMVQTVTIEGLTANSDGLYRLADLDARMAGAMAEYDAIEDAPTAVSSATRAVPSSEGHSYTLSGTPANASARGIVIRNGKKEIR